MKALSPLRCLQATHLRARDPDEREPLQRGTGSMWFRSTVATHTADRRRPARGIGWATARRWTIWGADNSRMAGAAKKGKPVKRGKDHGKRGPEWTSGLKQLYDSVVE